MEGITTENNSSFRTPQPDCNIRQIPNRSSVVYHSSTEDFSTILLPHTNTSSQEVPTSTRVLFYKSVENITILLPRPNPRIQQMPSPPPAFQDSHSNVFGCCVEIILYSAGIVGFVACMLLFRIFWSFITQKPGQ